MLGRSHRPSNSPPESIEIGSPLTGGGGAYCRPRIEGEVPLRRLRRPLEKFAPQITQFAKLRAEYF